MPVSFAARGQASFVYDQQSSTNVNIILGTGGVIPQSSGNGQAFTPGFSSIDFIRLKLYDGNTNNGLGATLYVNLRSSSITGPILSSTSPVALADGFGGTVNFFFSTPVLTSQGETYYFEPIAKSGDTWLIDTGPYNYPGGTAFVQRIAYPGGDFWFREGLIVPEPSSLTLLIGSGVLFYVRRAKNRK